MRPGYRHTEKADSEDKIIKWIVFTIAVFFSVVLAMIGVFSATALFYTPFATLIVAYVSTRTQPNEPAHLSCYRLVTSVMLACLFYQHFFKAVMIPKILMLFQ